MFRGGRHSTRGYFLAYRGFGDEGKEKRWLDKEIDHIGNGFAINYPKYGDFKFFHKGKVIAAKKRKSLIFSPSIYGQFEMGKKITGLFQRGFQVAVHVL